MPVRRGITRLLLLKVSKDCGAVSEKKVCAIESSRPSGSTITDDICDININKHDYTVRRLDDVESNDGEVSGNVYSINNLSKEGWENITSCFKEPALANAGGLDLLCKPRCISREQLSWMERIEVRSVVEQLMQRMYVSK